MEQGFCLPLHPASYPELKALYRLHLPVIIGMEIPFRRANVGMSHQSLDGPQIIPIIKKRRGKGMPHHVGMDSLLDQSPLCRQLGETVNGLWRQALFVLGTMLSQRLEEGMSRICPVPGSLVIVLYGE